ncbi:MAG: hypothetical protein NTV22_09825 [bacterium]|nr:hypothetical protein [bacterium]
MKTRFAVLAMMALTTALLMNVVTPTVRADASLSIGMSLNFDTCYNELGPYGTWYESSEFGWVWTPGGVAAGWGPYVNGNWACTSSGWMWQSSYPWGWMCYNYGRWARHPSLGWCWVPGYEWAPSWVTWYTYGNYVGWAPMAPCGFGASYTVYPSDWCFVNFNYFLSPMVWSYYVGAAFICPAVCAPYMVMNNYYFFGDQYYFAGGRRCDWYGPPVMDVERHVNRRIEPYVLSTTTDRSRNGTISRNQLEVYRPGMREGAALARSDRAMPAERVEKQSPPGAVGRVERSGNTAGTPGAVGRVERAGNTAGTPGSVARGERVGTPAINPGAVPRTERPGAGVTPSPGVTPRVEQPKLGVAPRPIQVPRADQLRSGWGTSARTPNVNTRTSFTPATSMQTRPTMPSTPRINQPIAQNTPRVNQPIAQNTPRVNQPIAQNTPRVNQPIAQNTPRVNQPIAQNTPRVNQPSAQNMPRVSQPVAQSMPRVSQPSAPSMPNVSAPRMSAPSMPNMSAGRSMPSGGGGGQMPMEAGGGRRR